MTSEFTFGERLEQARQLRDGFVRDLEALESGRASYFASSGIPKTEFMAMLKTQIDSLTTSLKHWGL